MKAKKSTLLIVAMVLVIALALGMIVACDDDSTGGTVVIGSVTALSGDFRWPGLYSGSAGAADQDIQKLTTGYSTMELNRSGVYVWNSTAVKSHSESATTDGTYLITIELNSGLLMSNGEELKADNYIAYILAMSTPIAEQAFGSKTAGSAYVGYSDFSDYEGNGDPVPFSGIRILSDYKFSLEVSSDFYPYYYVDNYGAITPYDLELVLGSGVEVKDDGKGAYLTSGWYAKPDGSEEYSKKSHLLSAQYDVSEYAFTGAYVISNWNDSSKEATLKLNDKFKGNFEGRKSTIPTIVYRKVVSATMLNDLKSGQVDIIEGLTGGEEVNGALAMVNEGGFGENHYDRAGYGKIQFDCDFGPTMFTEVRQAIAYSFDRNDFANTFCTGYGSVISAPYSVNFDAAQTLGDELENALNEYASSLSDAKSALIAGGWTYNSKGENLGADWAPGSGVDAVRYKKLSASEYGPNDVNKTYSGVTNEGNSFKTVKIGEDYYMPLVINWMCSEENPVSDLLTTTLKSSEIAKNAGMVITKTEADWTLLLGNIYRVASYGYSGTPTYGMFNLATGWNSSTYDYSFNWVDNSNAEQYELWESNSVNRLSDSYDAGFSWWDDSNQGLSFDEAKTASGGNLGMNYISMAMVYSVQPGDTAEYNKWFKEYMIRWNELLPDIPLYANIYYDVFNSNKISELKTGPFWGAVEELMYQDLK